MLPRILISFFLSLLFPLLCLSQSQEELIKAEQCKLLDQYTELCKGLKTVIESIPIHLPDSVYTLNDEERAKFFEMTRLKLRKAQMLIEHVDRMGELLYQFAQCDENNGSIIILPNSKATIESINQMKKVNHDTWLLEDNGELFQAFSQLLDLYQSLNVKYQKLKREQNQFANDLSAFINGS